MKDESFRLTPLDVRRTEFATAMRGYDKASVDAFRERVADELEDLARRNQELEGKARGFHEQLRAFREREKALNDALVSAQQLRAEMREQAEREGHLIIREARADGERLVDEMRMEQRRLTGDLEALDRARRAYVSQLRTLVERQLAELDAMAAVPPPAVILPASAPAGAPTPSVATPAPPHAAAAQAPPSTPPRGTRGASETPAWLNSVAKE
jgi:DivIVA domain-containing protein